MPRASQVASVRAVFCFRAARTRRQITIDFFYFCTKESNWHSSASFASTVVGLPQDHGALVPYTSLLYELSWLLAVTRICSRQLVALSVRSRRAQTMHSHQATTPGKARQTMSTQRRRRDQLQIASFPVEPRPSKQSLLSFLKRPSDTFLFHLETCRTRTFSWDVPLRTYSK